MTDVTAKNATGVPSCPETVISAGSVRISAATATATAACDGLWFLSSRLHML